jgi:hypothetical protein
VIRLDSLVVPGLQDRHRAPALEELHHRVFVLWIEMLDDHVRHAALLGHVREELLEASRPPAEAPIPTTGKRAAALAGAIAVTSGGAGFFFVAPRSAERAESDVERGVSRPAARAWRPRLDGRPFEFPTFFFMAEPR